jgi:hypothetical protein
VADAFDEVAAEVLRLLSGYHFDIKAPQKEGLGYITPQTGKMIALSKSITCITQLPPQRGGSTFLL